MQKVVSIEDNMINITESMDELKSMTLIGFWRILGISQTAG